ncbi:MAG: hypothetical protein GTO30_18305, partial [Acidobacteria bacterium]|nr:hypothetical protein [Acidobacteriota bacterium]NIQ84146.1 hypothetical protein [Acidobacteriota bacterium]
GRSADPAVERPPVLLITVDGLVAADAAPLGGAQEMPNLQRLVDQSAVWTTAQSATPMTRPAVAT